MIKPTIGRVVLYRSRTGLYTVPALVTAVQGSLYQPNVDAGYLDALSSDTHTHLSVLTPGRPNVRKDAPDFVVRPDVPAAPNVGGIYQEWDVPFWDPTDCGIFDHQHLDEQPAGTWTWPPRG